MIRPNVEGVWQSMTEKHQDRELILDFNNEPEKIEI